MKPVRVLLLITNLGKGGAQRVFYDHALAFSNFCTVEEVVFNLDQDRRIYDSGLPIHDLRRNDILSMLGSVGRLASRALALRKLVRTRQFDVVVSHMDGANWVNVLSFSAARKLLVVHGSVLGDRGMSPLLQWARRHVIFPLLYNRADQTVAVSAGIARELTEHCGVHNVCTIQNFFDLGAISALASLPLPDEVARALSRPGVLVTSGRFAPQKGQASLLDMLRMLLDRGVDTRLVILGDGELRDRLLRRCDDLQLSVFEAWNPAATCHGNYDVYFFGYVSNPFQYLARGTLFVFPSHWEGFPLALCEAMICGVPVLSADCPTGPREILAPGSDRNFDDLDEAELGSNGMLLPVVKSATDLDVWVDSVEALLCDAALRSSLALNGRRAMQLLDRSAVVTRWREHIEPVNAGN